MRTLRAWMARLGDPLGRDRREAELAHELRSHLEMHIEDNIRAGMTPLEARRQALLKLGGITRTAEAYREQRGFPLLETLWLDIRFGLRIWLRKPALAAAAAMTVGLGVGLNSAIFSTVYTVLIKPLPFSEPDRLLAIWKKNPSRGWSRNPISAAEFLAWRERTTAFADLAAFRESSCVLTGIGDPDELPCEVAPSNLFSLLGVAPIRGRGFSTEEDRSRGPRAAILSYGLWQRRFGGSNAAIGRSITLGGASYDVVGVMPRTFAHLYASPYSTAPEIWLSGIGLDPTSTWNDYFAVGRLKPGVPMSQAEAQMDIISAAVGRTHPDLEGWRAQLMSVRAMVSADGRYSLLVLLGAVLFVVLMACANLANLLLAHGVGRQGELVVRRAFGASRGRLIRQMLTETLLLSTAGGTLGLAFAVWGRRALLALGPEALSRSAPGLATAGVDGWLFAFAAVTTLVTSLVSGLAPAIRGSKMSVSDSLRETGRGSPEGRRTHQFRNTLAAAEIALAMVLLCGAGLMVRTLVRLSRLQLGFNPANVLTLRVPLRGIKYDQPEAEVQFWGQLIAAVEALPGVEAGTVSRGLPVADRAGQFITTAENPNPPAGHVPDADYVVISPHYFRALRIPLRQGRVFDERDTENASRVVVVSEELVRQFWPSQNPLGKQLRIGSNRSTEPWLSVVGVVGDVVSQGPESRFDARVYLPYRQYPLVLHPDRLLVRTIAGLNAASVALPIAREVRRLDPDQPIADVATMDDVTGRQFAEQRMVMSLLVAFAALALTLSVVGIYGVLSYSVAQRTGEIGLRMALGATAEGVHRLVIKAGSRTIVVGITIGTVVALALTRVMSGLLYDVRATDPGTFAIVAILLAATSLAACVLPARRATQVDPMTALRQH